MATGRFVVSIDFELMWGVRDRATIASYGANVLGVHSVIPRLLDTFDRFDVKGTFAIVGFLFYANKAALVDHLPAVVPTYRNPRLSPYGSYIAELPDSSAEYHFAPNLIKLIQARPQHEIGSHTFSHYYCLEEGQTAEQFRADLIAAKETANAWGIQITSLVFPRNQCNDAYVGVCDELGIVAIRGTERSWLYAARPGQEESLLRRAVRLLDSYVNISGDNCYADAELADGCPVDIPSSRFLRPYSRTLRGLDPWRLRRITTGMEVAARRGLTYHLWWHPHNFGLNQAENFSFLERILSRFQALQREYGFRSVTMTEAAREIQACRQRSL